MISNFVECNKAVLRGKFRALNSCIWKKGIKISDLIFQFKKKKNKINLKYKEGNNKEHKSLWNRKQTKEN